MAIASKRVVGAAIKVLGLEPSLQRRFTDVYRNNLWRDDESRSGEGSRRDSPCVVATLEALSDIVDEHGVRSISDIPCGDFNWIGPFLAARPEISYRGFDIVDALIASNRERHWGAKFDVLDISRTVPPAADLILCKDLLNHLDYATVRRALQNMAASGSRLLLASNNFGQTNVELPMYRGGMGRLLDITVEPLCFPKPIWSTHYLGLWHLAGFQQ